MLAIDIPPGVMLVAVVALVIALIPMAVALQRKRPGIAAICFLLSLAGIGMAVFGMVFKVGSSAWYVYFVGGCVAVALSILLGLVAQNPEKNSKEKVLQSTQWQLAQQKRQIARLAKQAQQSAAPVGFVQCPRCGAQNGEAQSACWQCKLPFQTAEAEVVAAPAVVAPPPVSKPPARPSAPSPTPTEIKVRCKACGKKFGGTVAQIASLKACPRCKATPFQSESAT